MSLRIVIGPMFAGKTSEIQSVVRRYSCLKKSVLVITTDIDTRYKPDARIKEGYTTVVNHDRVSIAARAVAVDGLMDILTWPEYKEATAIVVDEAQFFVNCLIPFVRTCVDRDSKHVVVVGLDSDANQQPFGDVLALIAHADSVEKKTALCRECGDGTPAIFTKAICEKQTQTQPQSQVSIGGAEKYEPVCRKHFR